jgi:DNA (cytosine-5)-methyltransferase 1
VTGATMFSGIQAPEVAAPQINWRWCAEIEPFPCAVIAQRHPQIPNLGDVTADDFIARATDGGPIDLMVFGSPCQSFSVAGRRLGLDDPRGNLALIALGIVNAVRPRWFLFENVPGLLSSWSGDEDDGEIVTEDSDFAGFIQTVQDIGYCGAWASPDAQWFGLAQRRERVFFVGHSGAWQGPTAVLSEFQGLSGYTPACVEARQRSAARADAGARSRGFWQSVAKAFGCGRKTGEAVEQEESGIKWPAEISPTLNTTWAHRSAGSQAQEWDSEHGGRFVPDVAMCLNAGGTRRIDGESETFIAHALRADGFDAGEDGTGRGTPLVAIPILEPGHDPVGTRVRLGMAVRRLTPRECERLQGFPDDFTLVTYRGKPAADGPRYKALGNSMPVPVIRYLIDRIQQTDAILHREAA